MTTSTRHGAVGSGISILLICVFVFSPLLVDVPISPKISGGGDEDDAGDDTRRLAATARDCMFHSWSAWSTCSFECQASRSRRLTPATAGGRPCFGPTEQLRGCAHGACSQNKGQKVDCKLAQWSAWSKCSKQCGCGMTHRSRKVMTPALGGGFPCMAVTKEVAGCVNNPCSKSESKKMLKQAHAEKTDMAELQKKINKEVQKIIKKQKDAKAVAGTEKRGEDGQDGEGGGQGDEGDGDADEYGGGDGDDENGSSPGNWTRKDAKRGFWYWLVYQIDLFCTWAVLVDLIITLIFACVSQQLDPTILFDAFIAAGMIFDLFFARRLPPILGRLAKPIIFLLKGEDKLEESDEESKHVYDVLAEPIIILLMGKDKLKERIEESKHVYVIATTVVIMVQLATSIALSNWIWVESFQKLSHPHPHAWHASHSSRSLSPSTTARSLSSHKELPAPDIHDWSSKPKVVANVRASIAWGFLLESVAVLAGAVLAGDGCAFFQNASNMYEFLAGVSTLLVVLHHPLPGTIGRLGKFAKKMKTCCPAENPTKVDPAEHKEDRAAE